MIAADRAKDVGTTIGIDWDDVDFTAEDLAQGISVELEHGSRDPDTDVTGDDLETTAKIAWAHLKERADYYQMLKKVEKASKKADHNIVRTALQGLGFAPGMWPEGYTGAKSLPVSLAALGASAGLGSAMLAGALGGADAPTNERMRRRMALLGALSGLGGGALLAALYATSGSSELPAPGRAMFSTSGPHSAWPYKQASLFGNQTNLSIPVSSTLAAISDDPFMPLATKIQLTGLMLNANQGQPAGLVSPQQVVAAAVDAGLGYVAGKTIGTILSLPEAAKKTLSRFGGLGGLLLSTGVVS